MGEFIVSITIPKPDAKGRITLGKLARGISDFEINTTAPHPIVLTPMIEIPAHEQWLFNNPDALKQVQQGLQEAGEGKLKSLSNLNDENL